MTRIIPVPGRARRAGKLSPASAASDDLTTAQVRARILPASSRQLMRDDHCGSAESTSSPEIGSALAALETVLCGRDPARRCSAIKPRNRGRLLIGMLDAGWLSMSSADISDRQPYVAACCQRSPRSSRDDSDRRSSLRPGIRRCRSDCSDEWRPTLSDSRSLAATSAPSADRRRSGHFHGSSARRMVLCRSLSRLPPGTPDAHGTSTVSTASGSHLRIIERVVQPAAFVAAEARERTIRSATSSRLRSSIRSGVTRKCL